MLTENDKKINRLFNKIIRESENYTSPPEKFHLGTPAVYGENSGEVALNREEVKVDRIIYPPRTIVGLSLYKDDNYRANGYRFIVPDWNKVKTFYEVNQENLE